jgi:carbamoyltransferase
MTPLTDGGFGVDTSYFGYHVGKNLTYSKKFIRELGPPREPRGEILPRHQDIAASLQARTEEIIVHLVKEALQHTKTKYLCLAGGVALNSVAVGKIIELGLAEEVYVPPCAGDAGVSLGAALYVAHHLSGQERQEPLLDARLGPEWSDEVIRETLEGTGLPYQEWTEGETVAALAAGQVVGWFQGRMEFGQRALGARSILADPRRPEMKDLINAKVKFREAFRPFAPAVPEERLSEFFHGTHPSPFMTQVYRVREESRPLLRAVTHVDGTARVQTVRRDFNPKFWSLLQAFEAQAGVPVLLNTSFNLRGEPIVNTPEEAVKSFLRADLDLLVMGRWAARKDPGKP